MTVRGDVRIPDLERFFPGIADAVINSPADVRRKAPAAGVDKRNSADFIGFQRLGHHRHDPLYSGQRYVFRLCLCNRGFAHKRNIGGEAQVVIFRTIQRIVITLRIGNRIVAESG